MQSIQRSGPARAFEPFRARSVGHGLGKGSTRNAALLLRTSAMRFQGRVSRDRGVQRPSLGLTSDSERNFASIGGLTTFDADQQDR